MKFLSVRNLLALPGLEDSAFRRVLHQLLLIALLSMMLLTPFLQIDSLDKFPVSTDDFEVQVTCCLSILGMLLVCARILKIIPQALRPGPAALPDGGTKRVFVSAVSLIPEDMLLHRRVPLRI